MTSPIKSSHSVEPIHSSDAWSSVQTDFDYSDVSSSRVSTKGAEEEIPSLYYLTTLKSLASPQEASEKVTAQQIGEKKETERSFLGRTKDWLWGLFGWGQKQPVSEQTTESINHDNSVEEDTYAGGIPRLQTPVNEQNRLSNAIADLNRELVNRLKDMAEFEEEMRKCSSSKMDKLIFIQLMQTSLNQKKLKEMSGLNSHEDVMAFHNRNQGLQKVHYNLLDAMSSENKARKVLKWVNVGLTAVVVGGTAIAFFAVAGPLGILAFGVPLALVGKGVTTLTDGILKYKNDAKTGELVVIKEEIKTNNSHVNDHLSEMQVSDNDIASLLKMIRQHLDNQSKAERASFGRHA